jgi:hypothetical protein
MPRKLVRMRANGGNGAAAALSAAPPVGPPPPDRARLRDAVQSLREAQSQLDRLQTARDTAREAGWGLNGAVRDFEQALRAAEADEPGRLALEFANGDVAVISPLIAAKERLAAKRQELERNDALERALDAEIAAGLREIPRREREVGAALAQIIMQSDATRSLVDAHRAAWAKLRSLRSALSVLVSQVLVHAPAGTTEKWLNTEPIEPNVRLLASEDSFPTDLSLAEGLQQALSDMIADPEHAPGLPAVI